MAAGFACGLNLEPRAFPTRPAGRTGSAGRTQAPGISAMIGLGRSRSDRSALPPIPFGAVNRAGCAGYVAGLQRHHLLPRVLIGQPCFARLIEALGASAAFEDFRRNGMLLPATEGAAVRMGLPLHRGPHSAYSDMVRERLGGIEADWVVASNRAPDEAGNAALRALAALQADLRRSLLDPRRIVRLNRSDPLGVGVDFTRIDTMAETLWAETLRAETFGVETFEAETLGAETLGAETLGGSAFQRPNGAVSVESSAIAA